MFQTFIVDNPSGRIRSANEMEKIINEKVLTYARDNGYTEVARTVNPSTTCAGEGRSLYVYTTYVVTSEFK